MLPNKIPSWSELQLNTNWDLLNAAILYKSIAGACVADKEAITEWTKQ